MPSASLTQSTVYICAWVEFHFFWYLCRCAQVQLGGLQPIEADLLIPFDHSTWEVDGLWHGWCRKSLIGVHARDWRMKRTASKLPREDDAKLTDHRSLLWSAYLETMHLSTRVFMSMTSPPIAVSWPCERWFIIKDINKCITQSENTIIIDSGTIPLSGGSYLRLPEKQTTFAGNTVSPHSEDETKENKADRGQPKEGNEGERDWKWQWEKAIISRNSDAMTAGDRQEKLQLISTLSSSPPPPTHTHNTWSATLSHNFSTSLSPPLPLITTHTAKFQYECVSSWVQAHTFDFEW